MIAEIARAKNRHGSTTKTRTRTEIRIESHEVLVMRTLSQPGVAGAEACGVDVRNVTLEPTARLAQTTGSDIGRTIKDKAPLAVETGEGATLVCSQTEKDK